MYQQLIIKQHKNKRQMKNLDSKIDNLKAGEQMQISSFNGVTVHVERTTDGKRLKYVRTYKDGSFTVFNNVRFNS